MPHPVQHFTWCILHINKQGDNIQPWHTPFQIWSQSVVPCPVLTVRTSNISVFKLLISMYKGLLPVVHFVDMCWVPIACCMLCIAWWTKTMSWQFSREDKQELSDHKRYVHANKEWGQQRDAHLLQEGHPSGNDNRAETWWWPAVTIKERRESALGWAKRMCKGHVAEAETEKESGARRGLGNHAGLGATRMGFTSPHMWLELGRTHNRGGRWPDFFLQKVTQSASGSEEGQGSSCRGQESS